MRTLLLSTTFLFGSGAVLAGQRPDSCFASSTDSPFNTVWFRRDGDPYSSASGPRAAPSAVELRAMLTGRYRVHLVTTEGVESPTVRTLSLWLIPTDSSGLATCWGSPCSRISQSYPLVGRLGGTAFADTNRLRRREFHGDPADVEVLLNHSSGNLSWQTGPGVEDGEGAGFDVAEVTPVGFRGRWEHDGLVVRRLDRDGFAVVEAERGYYCAYRAP